jgi:hypothetical protein
MKFWTDKKGKELTYKEFKERLKEGKKNITQVQRLKIQLSGTKMTLVGLILGIGVTMFNFLSLWWVMLVLFGATINTLVTYFSMKKQLETLMMLEGSQEVNLDDALKGGIK